MMRRHLAIMHLSRRLTVTYVVYLLRLQRPSRVILRSVLALRVRRVLRWRRSPRYQRFPIQGWSTWSGLPGRVIVLAGTSAVDLIVHRNVIPGDLARRRSVNVLSRIIAPWHLSRRSAHVFGRIIPPWHLSRCSAYVFSRIIPSGDSRRGRRLNVFCASTLRRPASVVRSRRWSAVAC
jgi:hypothetical protein